MGTPRGFNIYVGGTGGVVPREGNLLMENCTDEEVLKMVDKIVNYYKDNARRNDRLGRLIDRQGFESFKSDIVGFEQDEYSEVNGEGLGMNIHMGADQEIGDLEGIRRDREEGMIIGERNAMSNLEMGKKPLPYVSE